MLAVAEVVREPFMVVNADDYYGEKSYGLLAESLSAASPDTALLAAFRLGNTLPQEGTVSRGVCRVEGDRLTSLVETHGIGRADDGRIVSTDPVGRVSRRHAGLDEHVGLRARDLPRTSNAAGTSSTRSTRTIPRPSSCCRRPWPQLRDEGLLDVRAVHTDDEWIGVTNPDDLDPARARLHALRG